MKVALIGYGYWGQILAKYLDIHPVFELSAIYTSKDNIDRGTSNLEQIADSDIETVFIASPQETHYELTEQFLNAGKHVFCEKPFVASSQAKELFNLADSKGLKLHINYIYTVSQSILKMQELLPSIGSLHFAHFEMRQFGKFYKNQSAFEVLGCHMLSVFSLLFSSKISEQSFLLDSENKLSQQINCRHQQCPVSIYTSIESANKYCTIELKGDRGILVFNPLNQVPLIHYTINAETKELILESNYNFDEKNNIALALDSFMEIILGKKKTSQELVLHVARSLEIIGNANG